MSKDEDAFHEFVSDKLMRGQKKPDRYAPSRSDSTRKRMDDLEAERDLKRMIGKDLVDE